MKAQGRDAERLWGTIIGLSVIELIHGLETGMHVHGLSMLVMYSCIVRDEKHIMETGEMLYIIIEELKGEKFDDLLYWIQLLLGHNKVFWMLSK
jgi:hypothetical protein